MPYRACVRREPLNSAPSEISQHRGPGWVARVAMGGIERNELVEVVVCVGDCGFADCIVKRREEKRTTGRRSEFWGLREIDFVLKLEI